MNKVIIFAVFTIGFLLVGNLMWERKLDNQVSASFSQYKKDIEKEEMEHQKLLDSLDPVKNKNQSLIDFLRFKTLTNGSAVITVFGSSVSAGHGSSDYSHSWSGLLEDNIRNNFTDLHRVTIENLGKGGFSTQDLVENKVVDTVVSTKPDLVIFETALLNNHGQSISLEQTLKDITQIHRTLKENLPNAKIVFTSANPSAKKTDEELNILGYSYQDYINQTGDFIKGNDWYYINIYQRMNDHMRSKGINLKDISVDGIHPNDIGYQIWFEEMFNYMQEKH